MTAAVLRRLDKLETIRQPRGVVFIHWQRPGWPITPDDIAARAKLRKGDLLVCGTWPLNHSMPPARWATGTTGEFLHVEFGALARLVRFSRGTTEPARDPDELPRYQRPPHLNQTSDAHLIAMALAHRVGEPRKVLELRATPTPVLEAAREILTRANIRGCRNQLAVARIGKAP